MLEYSVYYLRWHIVNLNWPLWFSPYILIQFVWDFPLGHSYNFLNYDVFLSLKFVFILAHSADHDEMQHYAAFHLGLHRLSKYLSRGIQYTEG